MRICTLLGAALLFALGPTLSPAGDKEDKKGEIKLVDGKHSRAVNLQKADAKYEGKPAIVLTIKLEKGKSYQFDLTDTGTDGDPYLVLQDAKGKTLAQDDDGGENLNSRIVFRCDESGVFRIVCTVFEDEEDAAPFTLSIQEQK